MFSVIVPVYNTEKYLRRCVDSILAQTFTDFELLLINDGSSDNSGAICDEYAEKDSRVRVFHKENGGVSSARNLGLDNARGEWITFVDSDDWVESNWLYCFSTKINQIGTEYLIVTYARSLFEENTRLIIHNGSVGYLSKDDYFKRGEYGYLWNKCFCADIIKKQSLSFDLSMDCFEDEIFVLEYTRNLRGIYICNEITYNYYSPLDFSKKYEKNVDFKKQLYRYNRTKLYSKEASKILVDWLVMIMLKECSTDYKKIKKYALLIRVNVGDQIEYALGRKKIFMRLAKFIHCEIYWILIVFLYTLMYKCKLIN